MSVDVINPMAATNYSFTDPVDREIMRLPRPQDTHNPKLPSLQTRGFHVEDGNISSSPTGKGPLELPKLVNLSHRSSDSPEQDRWRSPQKTRPVMYATKSLHSHQSAEDDKPKIFNQEPMPFQSKSFNGASSPLLKVCIEGTSVTNRDIKGIDDRVQSNTHKRKTSVKERSSMMFKKVAITSRHGEMWGGSGGGGGVGVGAAGGGSDKSGVEYPISRNKGFVFHTDRYQWDDIGQQLECFNQRERLQAELEFRDRIRGVKRRRELLSHREPLDLLMGGRKVPLTERMDIMGEISKLKSVSHCLPTRAKDLYVGRGFKLPKSHKLNAPGKVKSKSVSPHFDKKGGSQSISVPHPKTDGEETGASEAEDGRQQGTAWTKQRDDEGIKSTAAKPDAGSEAERLAADDQPPQGGPSQSSHRPSKGGRSTEKFKVNPIKGCSALKLHSDDEMKRLKEIFERLSTESQVAYDHVQPHLPTGLSSYQDTYVQQVFEMTVGSNKFGEEQFVLLDALASKLAAMGEDAKESFEDLEAGEVSTYILQYVNAFESVDRQQVGSISVGALQQVLSTTLNKDLTDESLQEIKKQMGNASLEEVNKIDYIAFIPYFESLSD